MLEGHIQLMYMIYTLKCELFYNSVLNNFKKLTVLHLTICYKVFKYYVGKLRFAVITVIVGD